MWTLIVFTFLNTALGGAGGGAATAVSNYEFKTEAGCNAAAKVVQDARPGPGSYSTWAIITKCIETGK
jgi:hypothetical protein